MPIYTMSEEDMAELVVYPKRLETDLDPGVPDEDEGGSADDPAALFGDRPTPPPPVPADHGH